MLLSEDKYAYCPKILNTLTDCQGGARVNFSLAMKFRWISLAQVPALRPVFYRRGDMRGLDDPLFYRESPLFWSLRIVLFRLSASLVQEFHHRPFSSVVDRYQEYLMSYLREFCLNWVVRKRSDFRSLYSLSVFRYNSSKRVMLSMQKAVWPLRYSVPNVN
jgi:hypothetical protein